MLYQNLVMLQLFSSFSKQEVVPLCKEAHDTPSYYQPLVPCISSTTSKRWIPIYNRSSGSHLSSAELEVHGKYSSVDSSCFFMWSCNIFHFFFFGVVMDLLFFCVNIGLCNVHWSLGCSLFCYWLYSYVYIYRRSIRRLLWWTTNLAICFEKLLVLTYTSNFLWPSKEAWWWRSIASI